MSGSPTGRQLASALCTSLSKSSIPNARYVAKQSVRPFSSSSCRTAEGDGTDRGNLLSHLNRPPKTATSFAHKASSPSTRTPGQPQTKASTMAQLVSTIPVAQLASGRAVNDARSIDTSVFRGDSTDLDGLVAGAAEEDGRLAEPFHFHIYAHKHNTHITVTKPNRDTIVSLSCGNLGFRKSQRKHYDSAYQLGAYVIDKLQQQGWHNKINSLEVQLRGFGQGREAVTKVILGTEGQLLRDKIVKVSDATRLKFGGQRSKRPRRLG